MEYVEELMKILNIINFVKEVKQEGKKIVWPTRKETLITTAMVLLMVVSIFQFSFLLVDNIIAWFIKTLMGYGMKWIMLLQKSLDYKWFIIHTHSGFEAKVIDSIKEEVKKEN